MPRFPSPRGKAEGGSNRPGLDLVGWFAAGAIVLSIGACGQLQPPAESPTPSASDVSIVAPIMLEIATLDGTTQVVKITDGVVLIPPTDEEIELWGATISDANIASFQPGSVEYQLTLRPFIQPLGVGQTEITLKNSETEQTVIFTLMVTE